MMKRTEPMMKLQKAYGYQLPDGKLATRAEAIEWLRRAAIDEYIENLGPFKNSRDKTTITDFISKHGDKILELLQKAAEDVD